MSRHVCGQEERDRPEEVQRPPWFAKTLSARLKFVAGFLDQSTLLTAKDIESPDDAATAAACPQFSTINHFYFSYNLTGIAMMATGSLTRDCRFSIKPSAFRRAVNLRTLVFVAFVSKAPAPSALTSLATGMSFR